VCQFSSDSIVSVTKLFIGRKTSDSRARNYLFKQLIRFPQAANFHDGDGGEQLG
jgi:hypothetical protein